MKKKLMTLLFFFCIHSGVAHEPRPQKVFILLQEPSLSEAVSMYSSHYQTRPDRDWQTVYSRHLLQQQNLMRQKIAKFVLKEHSALQIALNGFRATVYAHDLDRLRRVDGVKSITAIQSYDMDNIDSVDWIEAPKVWENFVDGAGMTIAVIDSGIDYLHQNFGGKGDVDAYANNDPNMIEANTFPTAKVIGGWDFAGPTYDSRDDDAEPMPDADPLDLNGHGSHVAGTAAGIGVTSNGGGAIIGPGVAKSANLLALKVFSDEGGSTDLVVDAIERALDPDQNGSMDDHVDVINMSLGARFGLPTDASTMAATNAVSAGVIVVASAGNNGELPYVVGSPGVSESVITVAASISGGRRQIAVSANIDGKSQLFPALEGAGPVRLDETLVTRPVKLARSSTSLLDETHMACKPLINGDEVKEAFVLVQRGGCNFPTKYTYVQSAGGKGMILINSSDEVSELFVMGGFSDMDDSIFIPGVMITQAHGEILKNVLDDDTQGLLATLSTRITVPTPTDQDDALAFFTSQGPAGGGAFKPDLAAPGRYVFSTAAGTGNGGMERRGTSMAAPHVAGMAALIKQRYPGFPPATVKSMLMNTTVVSHQNDADSTMPYPVSRQGSGVIRGGSAIVNDVFTQPTGLSFGYLNPLVNATYAHQFTLHNYSARTREFVFEHQSAVHIDGTQITCPAPVTLGPFEQAVMTIQLDVEPDDVPTDDTQLSFHEMSGWCVFTNDRQTRRIAYIASIDGASGIAVQPQNITISNSGPKPGIAHSFLLAAQGEPKPDQAFIIDAFGWRETTKFNFPLLEFAVVLNKPWDNPSNYRYFIYVDTDLDDQYEMALFALDWSILGFDPGMIITGTDRPLPFQDIGGDTSQSQWFVQDVDYNDRVIILPFFNADSGVNAVFKPYVTGFNYKLVVADRYGNTDEVEGFIDLHNALAMSQHSLSVGAGQTIPLNSIDAPQLWLVPSNQEQDQFFVVP